MAKKRRTVLTSKKGKQKLPPVKQIPKKEPPTRINFLERRKNDREKFEDVTAKYKKDAFTIDRNGELSFSKRKYDSLIKKDLKLSTAQLKRLREGKTNKQDKKKLNRLHKGFSKQTKTSKNFRRDQVPSRLKIRRKIKPLKKDEVYHLRAGLRVVYKSDTSNTEIMYEGKPTKIWLVPNYPVSIDSDLPISKAIEFFLSYIKSKLEAYDSMLFFSFNYFDIQIVSTSTTEKAKTQVKKKRKKK